MSKQECKFLITFRLVNELFKDLISSPNVFNMICIIIRATVNGALRESGNANLITDKLSAEVTVVGEEFGAAYIEEVFDLQGKCPDCFTHTT